MRWWNLFGMDMRFLMKYGFCFLYAILTAVYVIFLWAIPEGWREKAAAILIFSDPAAMGLFFMGAIVLLEKSQHTPCALAVSPIRPAEYVLAKVGSLSVLSLAVAAALALAAGVKHVGAVLLGTSISSVIFTLLGIVIATRIVSLNQFMLWAAPVEIVCFVPATLHLFGITPAWLRHGPINACMDMVSGHAASAAGFCMALALAAGLWILAGRCVLGMWSGMGGAKE